MADQKPSPEELASLRALIERNTARMKALKPELFGGEVDDPTEKDLWAGAENQNKSPGTYRMGASFGNDPGITDKLKELGYVEVKRNKNGDMVAKKANGKWYKDLPDDLFSWGHAGPIPYPNGLSDHPIDAALRKAENIGGKALMPIGAVGGAVAGIPADLATLNPLASIAGAGAFGAAGDAAKNAVGKHYGFYKGTPMDQAVDAAGAFGESAASELGGQLAHAIPVVGKAVDWVSGKGLDLTRKAASGMSSFLTGVPADSVETLIKDAGAYGLNLGMAGGKTMHPASNAEMGATIDAEMQRRKGDPIKKLLPARENTKTNFAGNMRSTQPQITVLRQAQKQTPMSSTGMGLLSPEERQGMEGFIRDELTTPRVEPTPNPGAAITEPIFDQDPANMVTMKPGAAYTPIEPTPSLDAKGNPITSMGWDYKPKPVMKFAPSKGTAKPGQLPAWLKPKEGDAVSEVIAPPVQYSPWTGYRNYMPERPADDLLPMADELGWRNRSYYDRNPNMRRTPIGDAADQQVTALTKDDLHTMDPGLAKADADYNLAKRQRKTLGRMGFGDEARSEGAAGSIAQGENRTTQREALKAQAPDAWNDTAKHRMAYEDFNEDSPIKGLLPTARSVVRGLVAGGLGAGGYAATHSPLEAGTAAMVALGLSSPKAHFYTLGPASWALTPWTRPLRQNGLRALEGPLMASPKQTPWRSLFPQTDQQENQK
jgi:hypothetical protein